MPFYQISQLLKVAKYILKLAKFVAFGIKYCKGSLKRAKFSNKIATLPPNVTRGATRFRESVLSNDSFHNCFRIDSLTSTLCVPMRTLSTLSALNSIENDNITSFRMDGMHIGTQPDTESVPVIHYRDPTQKNDS